MNRTIDHIVYCVPDLETSVNHLEELLGIRPAIGGRHLTKGTKNALLNLGNGCYLEILAIDKENKEYKDQRWMGIDLINEPKITRWCLKSENLVSDSKTISNYSSDLSRIDGGSRRTADDKSLSWQMILPIATPEVELIPFLVDWSQSDVHPTDALEGGCVLNKVNLFHPHPSKVQPVLDNLGCDIKIVNAEHVRISLEIASPNGIIEID